MPSFCFSSDVLPKRREKRLKTPQSLSRPWQRETGWGKKREAFRSSEREFLELGWGRETFRRNVLKFQRVNFPGDESCCLKEPLLCSDGDMVFV
ncbi:hypothetical protein TNCV_3497351 [Trichonephila clavipes]|nr:hypothetical protein TNCV_3497351 [Trichonephila clavipes]